MTITIKFFGSVREEVDQSVLELEVTEPLGTVTDVWVKATNNAPLDDEMFCSVNMEHRALDFAVKDGDEIAFFPAVTGG